MIHNTSLQWTLEFGTVLNSERHYGTTLAKTVILYYGKVLIGTK